MSEIVNTEIKSFIDNCKACLYLASTKNFTRLAQQLSLEAEYKFCQSTKLFCYILQEKYLNKTQIFFNHPLHNIYHEPTSLLLSLYKFTWLSG